MFIIPPRYCCCKQLASNCISTISKLILTILKRQGSTSIIQRTHKGRGPSISLPRAVSKPPDRRLKGSSRGIRGHKDFLLVETSGCRRGCRGLVPCDIAVALLIGDSNQQWYQWWQWYLRSLETAWFFSQCFGQVQHLQLSSQKVSSVLIL